MKLKKDYVLRQIANTWVVLPLAEEMVNFSGMLRLNDSGAMLWKAMEQGADEIAMSKLLVSEYGISESQAVEDVQAFLEKLLQIGCMENT